MLRLLVSAVMPVWVASLWKSLHMTSQPRGDIAVEAQPLLKQSRVDLNDGDQYQKMVRSIGEFLTRTSADCRRTPSALNEGSDSEKWGCENHTPRRSWIDGLIKGVLRVSLSCCLTSWRAGAEFHSQSLRPLIKELSKHEWPPSSVVQNLTCTDLGFHHVPAGLRA
ncbi:hypothetical protein GE09DRAFT_80478 [Coniochaeta sp. 2T2.1]|nr:hypothetical protein GE09DRAFT_80478 [Coniochaeta sp. 2T2.1]